MSHSVFQTAQIMPLAPTPNSLSSKSLLSTTTVFRHSLFPPTAGKLRKCHYTFRASSSAVVDGDATAGLERCFQASPPALDAPSTSPSSVNFGPVMKGGKYGAFGAVTLEKSKLDMTQKQTKSSPEIATGGGGGSKGKGLSHGGGDGGDDGGDDDDYFDDFDEGDDGDDGGLFRRRMVLGELFDRKFVEAVLNEWQKTMMDLPAGFRQAYEMGLVSSAQMVRFLAINARPTTARFISRSLPQGLSRAFVGRMIADPAFLYRLLLEQATTIGCSVWWEIKNRKERIKQEWDLALINVLTVTACNAMVVWSLAPCRSYGNTFQFDLQNTLQKLPNNIFEKSYPMREFDFQKRLQSFFYKAAELCMVGFTAGAAQGAVSNLVASKKEGRLSVTTPCVSSNALGYGAFLGLYANLRYQLLCGLDRGVTSHFDVIGVALFLSTAMRMLNVQLGETSRLAWLGVEVDPLSHSDDLLKAAYSRPSVADSQSNSSKWFISKNAIVSGLGLLGIRQGQSDSTVEGDGGSGAPTPKARRKRTVRRKVATT
ncbi:hypothetical protein CASFOL_035784 [Castilleja foliolosa]|uniref:Protein RETICULATA-RELATED 1, chloroplastic n=1 Tax=Castilleja foliolosa TaxID=1961234 RepID=A0ABD3BUB8_9LAMI